VNKQSQLTGGLCLIFAVFAVRVQAQERSASHVDPLARLITWSADTRLETASVIVTLPHALELAIRRVSPRFRMRTLAEAPSFSYEKRQGRSPVGMVEDLDRDGRLEAVLWGVETGSDRPEPPVMVLGEDARLHPLSTSGPAGTTQKTIVLGIRQKKSGFEVTVLHSGAETLHSTNDGALPQSTRYLSVVSVGKPSRHRPGRDQIWIRWQDDYCKEIGYQWTVRQDVWIRATSPCIAGD
jgi:hypothetical protein